MGESGGGDDGGGFFTPPLLLLEPFRRDSPWIRLKENPTRGRANPLQTGRGRRGRPPHPDHNQPLLKVAIRENTGEITWRANMCPHYPGEADSSGGDGAETLIIPKKTSTPPRQHAVTAPYLFMGLYKFLSAEMPSSAVCLIWEISSRQSVLSSAAFLAPHKQKQSL